MKNSIKTLRDMAIRELTGNILPFWVTHAVDDARGGFYGELAHDGAPIPDADKNLILNARLVWTFAAAWRVLGDWSHLDAAQRAYAYFTQHFLDPQFGGAYYLLTCDGTPSQDFKLIYGQAFAIYALAEYHRATGDQDALSKAYALFDLLESRATCPNGGYLEVFRRDFSAFDAPIPVPINPGGERAMSMNTHLHMIEAYTCLLRAQPNARVEAAVRRLLAIMLDRVVNPETNHFHMFFRRDWTNVDSVVSYGHDIEGSWLMMESCDVLGDAAARNRAMPICLAMAQACLEEAVQPDGSILYEYDPTTAHGDRMRRWWAQAEAVVGFLNAHELSGDDRFSDAALHCLEYIDRHMVDHAHGEWFEALNEQGLPLEPTGKKATGWKCPYHNARMCLEIIERTSK